MEQPERRTFTTPDEEIAYLRGELASRTNSESGVSAEVTTAEAAKETLTEYARRTPEEVLAPPLIADDAALSVMGERVDRADSKVDEVMNVVHEQGIKNALSLLAKLDDPYTSDEVHRRLIEEISEGATIKDLKENVPPWQVLHMSLFEIALPEQKTEGAAVELSALLSAMEQFYAGMQAVAAKKPMHYALEIAIAEGSDHIVFYAAVPTVSVNLFEKQILSLFPHAVLTLAKHDYNIFASGGHSVASRATLTEHPVYPIRTYDDFSTDPLFVLLNTLSKIDRESGAAIQLVIQAGRNSYYETYEGIVKNVRDGMKVKEAIKRSTIGGEVFATVTELFKKKKEDEVSPVTNDQEAIELFTKKIGRQIAPANVRLVVSAPDEARASQILGDIEAGFHQFEDTTSNGFAFKRVKGAEERKLIKSFVFREYRKEYAMPLSFAELATVMHVPSEGIEAAPQFKQSRAASAPAPIELPYEGTLLGVNMYRTVETKVYLTAEDRLRHFYIIGQTGTGKTTLMKNMIIQDIEDGAGACLIDPHGSDIADVLSAVPEHRREDVIYFDPSRTDRIIGLNMLEYDQTHPEQKTFVVNELFSIFQKLYGGVPESMGPMFEQYFRNATLLVLDDPESSSTLLDISRVMVDSAYRKQKLERARNPVVVQFWTEIATKAGGEAALENIVPYITSKFDVFTANDYIRPIIGQQRSSFNFRELMDNRKILLVNLAKGRLGEINANLIGMMLVGKILMAAMSRVDDPSKSYPPFYLHMDEFQNVMTDSIAAILSEARKYKLGLTVAHQYIAQLDEKISDAVFGNVGSIAAFRVGSDDAEFLERQFAPTFTDSDLLNIENHHAYVRILANGTPTKPFDISTLPPKETDLSRVEALIEQSAARYGQPRRKVEMDISSRYRV
ncbi:MAG: DUF87 domain-containing protein [Candidatus Paceibacterota bacterium]